MLEFMDGGSFKDIIDKYCPANHFHGLDDDGLRREYDELGVSNEGFSSILTSLSFCRKLRCCWKQERILKHSAGTLCSKLPWVCRRCTRTMSCTEISNQRTSCVRKTAGSR